MPNSPQLEREFVFFKVFFLYYFCLSQVSGMVDNYEGWRGYQPIEKIRGED